MMEIQTNVFKNHLYGARLCKRLYKTPYKNAMIHYNKKQNNMYIVLQGTNTIKHWVHNFSLFLTKDEGIHSGFKAYAELCKNELVEDIMMNRYLKEVESFDEVDNIYFVAHSLGASAILILVYELLKENYFKNYLSDINVDIVLFGAPKSGNDIFINKFNNLLETYKNLKVYRYNIKYDFIKHYPPILKYSHVCKDIILENDLLKMNKIIYNHSINCYIKHLENYYKEIRKNNFFFLKIDDNM